MRALSFRHNYMSKLWTYMGIVGRKSTFETYLVSEKSVCFSLSHRIDWLIKLKLSDVTMGDKNDDGMRFLSITLDLSKNFQLYTHEVFHTRIQYYVLLMGKGLLHLLYFDRNPYKFCTMLDAPCESTYKSEDHLYVQWIFSKRKD